jgi:hypothetical protein
MAAKNGMPTLEEFSASLSSMDTDLERINGEGHLTPAQYKKQRIKMDQLLKRAGLK